MFKLGIFDLSWTLVGYDQSMTFECTRDILSSYCETISDREVRDYLALDMHGRRFRRKAWGIADDSEFAGRWNTPHVIRKKAAHAFCFPDVRALIKLRERGLKLAVISSSPPILAREEVAVVTRALGTWPFDVHLDVSRESGEPMKPSPESALRCIRGFGLSADETFAVGNDDDDIRFAKNAKVASVWIDRGIDLRSVDPDHAIKSMEQLFQII